MIKVLFVCWGNICRSPMAEFIFKDMVKARGLDEMFEIHSAATSNEEIGNPVYPPARAELAKHGIGCDGKTARRMTKADYDNFDYIIGMEDLNTRYILKIVGEDSEGKVKKLLDYTEHGGDIADPWYTRDFTTTYREIVEGCEAFLDKVVNHYI